MRTERRGTTRRDEPLRLTTGRLAGVLRLAVGERIGEPALRRLMDAFDADAVLLTPTESPRRRPRADHPVERPVLQLFNRRLKDIESIYTPAVVAGHLAHVVGVAGRASPTQRWRLGQVGGLSVRFVAHCGEPSAVVMLRRSPPFDSNDERLLGAIFDVLAHRFEPVPRDHAVGRLNAMQRDTLQLLLTGASEKEIAQRMNRSPHTVHSHVKKIYRQFGVSSRAELLSRFIDRGGDFEPD